MNRFLYLYFILISSHLYSQDFWTQKADAPSNYLRCPFSFSIGNKGFVGGGTDSSNVSSIEFWEYDPIANSWTQKADFCCQRFRANAISLQGKAYVGLGFDPLNGVYQNDWWEYDPQTDIWTQKANFEGGGRAGSVTFSINGKGYVCAGIDNSYHLCNDLWEYDPVLDTWTEKASCPGIARYCGIGFSIGNMGYIGGGIDTTTAIYATDFWQYDPSANTWLQKCNIPSAEFEDAGTFSIGEYGYVYGGELFYLYSDTLWQYNQALDQWNQKATFPGLPRDEVAAFSIGNKGYVGWGGEDHPDYKDFWEYTPDSSEISDVHVNKNDNPFVTVVPNPFTSHATIIFDKQLRNAQVIILDPIGNEIRKYKYVNGNNLSLNGCDFLGGIYFYQITENNIIIANGKFIFNKN